MAQLRQDHEQFKQQDAAILVVGPEKAGAFQDYWQKENLPYLGLPDPKHTVLKLYGQQIKIFKFGRMPAQTLIDKNGVVRYVHYGHDMTDIPENSEILGLLNSLNGKTAVNEESD
jgi:peroxiredoxin Q/BCP